VSHRVLALAAAVALGCNSPGPAPKAVAKPKVEAAAATPAAAAPAPKAAAAAEPEWFYSGAGKRDPFRSFLAEMSKETNSFTSRCAGPLGKFDLEQFKLVAVITGLEDPVAMVEAPDGRGFPIRRGSCIGKNGGVVAAVRTGEVVVTEWLVRADGTRDSIQTPLQLPREQAQSEE
jgi:type IV pilus assembly protein PilP